MKRIRQPLPASSQQANRDLHVVGQAQDSMLSETEATARVKVFDACKHPVRQFRKWADRWGCPRTYVGRRRVYNARLLDAFLERHRQGA